MLKMFRAAKVLPIMRSNVAGVLPILATIDGIPIALQCDSTGKLFVNNDPPTTSAISVPAVNTIASATQAANATRRLICNSVTFSVNAINAIAAPIDLVLRDGLTGVGAIIWATKVGPFGANSFHTKTFTGLFVLGSFNTAMTLEFGTAPGAGNFQTVTLLTYSQT